MINARTVTRIIHTALIVMLLSSVTTVFGQTKTNLIHDFSFEKPVVASGTFQEFSTGEMFKQWLVVGDLGRVAVVSGTFTQNGFTFPAKIGAQWLDLTGADSKTATGVSQTISTIPGASYTLTFYVGNVYDPHGIFGVSSTVNVQVDGQQVFKATNSRGRGETSMIWQRFTTTISATNATTTIAFINGDPPNDDHNGLDGIDLVLNAD